MPESPPHGIFELAPSSTLGLTKGLLVSSAMVVLLIVLLTIFFIWRWKRGQKREATVPRDPWGDLLHHVRESAQTSSPTQSMTILNDSLRKALEMRLSLPYTAYTSAEIMAQLQKTSGFSSDFQAECGEFLKTADRVLFAFQPYPKDARVHWEGVITQWLESLKQGRAL